MENYIIIIPFPEFFEQRNGLVEKYLEINLKHCDPLKLIKIIFLKVTQVEKIIYLLSDELDGYKEIKPNLTLKFEEGNAAYAFFTHCNILKILVNCHVPRPLEEKALFFKKEENSVP